jgi:hypothetical protein
LAAGGDHRHELGYRRLERVFQRVAQPVLQFSAAENVDAFFRLFGRFAILVVSFIVIAGLLSAGDRSPLGVKVMLVNALVRRTCAYWGAPGTCLEDLASSGAPTSSSRSAWSDNVRRPWGLPSIS